MSSLQPIYSFYFFIVATFNFVLANQPHFIEIIVLSG